MCLHCLARWQLLTLGPRLQPLRQPRFTRYRMLHGMRVDMQTPPDSSDAPVAAEFASEGIIHPPPPSLPPARMVYLVRHGETTFNLEGRLPGQLEGVGLTEKGRRQAYQAAVALSGVPLSAVISSPLERAAQTAQALARGGGLEVRLDPRLMDTDVGLWAGQKVGDLEKNDPSWKAFVEHPDEPPPGVESLIQVQQRVMAMMHDVIADASLGNFIALVAHADVVKLILATYLGLHVRTVRFVSVANASISALAFLPEQPARVLAINWTPLPAWLAPHPRPATSGASEQAQTGGIVGVQPPVEQETRREESATGDAPSVVF